MMRKINHSRNSFIVLFLILFLAACKEDKEDIEVFISDTENYIAFDYFQTGIGLHRGIFLLNVTREGLESFQPVIHTNYQELNIDGKMYSSGDRIDFSGKQLSDSLYFTYRNNQGDIVDGYLYFTTLPVMQIYTLENIPDEPKIDCEISLCDHYIEGGESVTFSAGIEYRGRTAAIHPKQSFAIEIRQGSGAASSGLSLLGMREDDDWILDAMYIDKARMRNKLSMDLWRDICLESANEKIHGKPYAAYEYVELFLNYEYMGIYALGESIDPKQLNLNPTANISDVLLYKTEVWTVSTRFEELVDTNTSAFWDGWVQVMPDPEEFVYWQAPYNFTDLVINGSDDEFEEQIVKYLDIDNLIDYHIFINTCKAYDNMGTNMFYARPSIDDPFIIYPWDLDASWGRNWDSTILSSGVIIGNPYYGRLIELDVDHFTGRMASRWSELRSTLISHELLFNRVKDNASALIESGSMCRESSKWPEMNLDLDAELNYMDEWIEERIKYLDEYYNNLPN
jgi:hypothetical protein